MKLNEVSEAINNDKVVRFSNGDYQIVGYKVMKIRGKKEHFLAILDLRNQRTILWVGLNDI